MCLILPSNDFLDSATPMSARPDSLAKSHLRNVNQRPAVAPGLRTKSYQHHFVNRLLANAPYDRVGEPDQRIVEVDYLKNRLEGIDPQVASPDVGQLVDQNRFQILRRQSVREAPPG